MNTNAPTTNHYAPGPNRATPDKLPERVAAAYRAVGLTPPSRRAPVEVAMAKMPAAETVAIELATEALTVTDKDADKWTKAAAARLAEARDADELRHALHKYRAAAVKAASRDMMTAAVKALTPAFDKAVDTLTEAAKVLPDPPFDLAAVVATDTTREMREAGEALQVLARLGDIHLARSSSNMGRTLTGMLPVVDVVPEVAPQVLDRLTNRPLDAEDPDAEAREAVRAFANDAGEHGADATLVRVARGAYGDHVRLALAVDGAALHYRHRRLSAAFANTLADSWGRGQKRRTPSFLTGA